MILPNKYLSEHETLLGVSAALLPFLKTERPLSSLWDDVRKIPNVGTYERFILGLDFLYLLGVVEVNGNHITRVRS